MKLRIQGNSIGFRVTRSEVARLMDAGRIEEMIYFTSDDKACLVYALEQYGNSQEIGLRYESSSVVVVIPKQLEERGLLAIRSESTTALISAGKEP